MGFLSNMIKSKVRKVAQDGTNYTFDPAKKTLTAPAPADTRPSPFGMSIKLAKTVPSPVIGRPMPTIAINPGPAPTVAASDPRRKLLAFRMLGGKKLLDY